MALAYIEIPLASGAGVAKIDIDDYDDISSCPWHALKDRNTGRTRYARRAYWDGSRVVTELMHRRLTSSRFAVDHRNGDGLDNRRANLREATHGQNMMNRKPWGRSGYLGVTFHKKTGKWVAAYSKGGKRTHVGLFASPIEAARARDDAALAEYGEFARLNFSGVVP